VEDEVKERSVKSYRKEQYTLIPQQPGTLTLPEISIAWWDVTKNEKAVARIPSRTLQVSPAPISQIALADEATPTVLASQEVVIQRDPLLYVFIGGLTLLLIVALFWGITLQKKIGRMTDTSTDKKPAEKREKAPQPSVVVV